MIERSDIRLSVGAMVLAVVGLFAGIVLVVDASAGQMSSSLSGFDSVRSIVSETVAARNHLAPR